MGNTDLRQKDKNEAQAAALRASLPDADEAYRLARKAQGASDATRLTLLLLLREAGKLCVADICLILERGQSSVSHHLKVALDAGLVSRTRFDLWSYYELTQAGQRLLDALLEEAEPVHSPDSSPK